MPLSERNQSLDRVYLTMPTETQLMNDINTDNAARINRNYVLPPGNLSVSGILFVKCGCLKGQGWGTLGTNIILDVGGQVKINGLASIKNLQIVQNSGATLNALVTAHGAMYANAEDIMVTGGNTSSSPTTYGIELADIYNSYWKNIFVQTYNNGVLFSFTGPYNPGDCQFDGLCISLYSNNTTGLVIQGDTGAQSGNGSNIINDIILNHCYITGGNNAGWATGNVTGMNITNSAKWVFNKINIEECNPAIVMQGQVGGGSYTTDMVFVGGWVMENIILNAGVGSGISFYGTRIEGSITGINAANIFSPKIGGISLLGWVNLLRHPTVITPTVTAGTFDTAPTNLGNMTDGNPDSATGWGITSKGTANQYCGEVKIDLGSIMAFIPYIRTGMYLTNASGSLTLYADASEDNITYNQTETLTQTAAAGSTAAAEDIRSCRQVAFYGRYLRLRYYMSAINTANMRLWEAAIKQFPII